jgi:protein O-mannosyl-transferase
MSKKGKRESSEKTSGTNLLPPNQFKALYLIVLALILSLIAYIPAFDAQFVNWDDQDYVMNNELIRSFTDFSKFFTTTVQGNYHPLTMLSLALNYAISGNNPVSYHALNILLHLVNVFLVFIFIKKLSGNNTFLAFATSILFGVHPMHVESVAWVSERKDVLYSLFFILGLIQYLKYLDENERKHYWMTLGWFALSILSKPAAIIFPVVLFTLDYYRNRSFTRQVIFEKIPFVIFSIILIGITIHYQQEAGATPLTTIYEWEKRIFFPFYGYMMYILKMFWPVNLCTFYPFPAVNEALSKAYTLSPLFFAATTILCWKTWKKYPEISFGFGFYFLNLVLVLQFFMFGSAIIADRYTYIPYIGLFFTLAWFLESWLKLSQKNLYILIVGISLILTFLSYRQSATWKDTASIWDTAIKNHPSAKAYSNRAYLYQQNGDMDKAIDTYKKALKLNIGSKEVYFNLGVLYFHKNMDELALEHYNKALELKPDYADALNGRGSLYARQGKNDLALADFDKLKNISPDYQIVYKNRAAAFFKEGKWDQAIKEYKDYLQIQKNDAEAYYNLAVVYANKGSQDEAIKAYEEAIKINPRYLQAYINAGSALANQKQFPKALEYLNSAFKIDSTNEENLKLLSLCYLNLGDTLKALSFFELSNKLKGN